MKNYIEIIDDDAIEDKIERFYNKNKKFIVPLLLVIVIAVFSFDKYQIEEHNNYTEQHALADGMIVSNRYDDDVLLELNDFYKLKVLTSITKNSPPTNKILQDILNVNPIDGILLDLSINTSVGLMMDLDKIDQAIDLLKSHKHKTSIQWMLLGDLNLLKFNFEQATGSYEMALSLSKTTEFKNVLKIKTHHATLSYKQKGGK